MNFYKFNKAAWEEAYNNRIDGWGKNIFDEIKKDSFPFLEKKRFQLSYILISEKNF
jgi:hypothetical protein